MNIERLEIKGFGKLKDLSVIFTSGLNVVYGSNEAGKSSLLWFIKGMLYGLKGGRLSRDGIAPPLRRYKPWTGDPYGGFMEYRLENGSLFRVERDFSPASVKIFESNFQEITGEFEYSRETGPLFAEKHLGLNEACFEKTVLIGQMETRMDSNGGSELLNRLINTAQTGFEDISFKNAQESLKETMKSRIGTDRTTTGPLNKTLLRLKELKALRPQMIEKRNRQAQVEAELRINHTRRARLEKIFAVLHKAKEIAALRISADKARTLKSGLAGHLDALETLEALENKSIAPDGEKILRTQAGRRNMNVGLIFLAALFALSIGSAFMLPEFRTPGLAASALVFVTAGLLCFFRFRMSKKLSGLERTRDIQGVSSKNSKAQQIAALKESISRTKSQISALDNSLEASLSDLEILYGGIQTPEYGIDTLFHSITTLDPIELDASVVRSLERADRELKHLLMKISEGETLLSLSNKEDERLQAIDEEMAETKAQIASLEDTGKALSLALELLTEASLEIQRDFAPGLNRRMGGIIQKITHSRYGDLRADNRLSLNTIAPETGGVTPVQLLSGGTADQMYLALRLAATDLITAEGEKPPLLLDEIFAQYDDLRTRETLEYLENLSGQTQIILFTCKKREVDIAREISPAANIIELG